MLPIQQGEGEPQSKCKGAEEVVIPSKTGAQSSADGANISWQAILNNVLRHSRARCFDVVQGNPPPPPSDTSCSNGLALGAAAYVPVGLRASARDSGLFAAWPAPSCVILAPEPLRGNSRTLPRSKEPLGLPLQEIAPPGPPRLSDIDEEGEDARMGQQLGSAHEPLSELRRRRAHLDASSSGRHQAPGIQQGLSRLAQKQRRLLEQQQARWLAANSDVSVQEEISGAAPSTTPVIAQRESLLEAYLACVDGIITGCLITALGFVAFHTWGWRCWWTIVLAGLLVNGCTDRVMAGEAGDLALEWLGITEGFVVRRDALSPLEMPDQPSMEVPLACFNGLTTGCMLTSLGLLALNTLGWRCGVVIVLGGILVNVLRREGPGHGVEMPD